MQHWQTPLDLQQEKQISVFLKRDFELDPKAQRKVVNGLRQTLHSAPKRSLTILILVTDSFPRQDLQRTGNSSSSHC
jgi:hypothetical protein